MNQSRSNVTKFPQKKAMQLPHQGCCDNCRQATALLERILDLVDVWELQEEMYTDDLLTQRLSRALLHVAGNQVRATLGVPEHPLHRRKHA